MCWPNGSFVWNECPDHEWNFGFVGVGKVLRQFSWSVAVSPG